MPAAVGHGVERACAVDAHAARRTFPAAVT